MKISHLLAFFWVLLGQAWAATPAVPATAETEFLQRAMALQGMDLSQAELQQRASEALTAYDKTAAVDGREERMAGALVAMNVMTGAQVTAFQKTIDTNSTIALASTTDVQSAMTLTFQNTFAHGNAGAEFSSCQSGLEWGTGFAIGSAALFGTGFYLKDVRNESTMGPNQLFDNALGSISSLIGGAALAVASIIMFATSGAEMTDFGWLRSRARSVGAFERGRKCMGHG